MDLAASATFVAEPAEYNIMRRKPRDPSLRFVDRPMLTNISLAAISLAVAVLFNYLLAYFSGRDTIEAQTIAFGTWLLGHVFLALTMRSTSRNTNQIGLFSNPIMLIWATVAVIFLVIITTVPVLRRLYGHLAQHFRLDDCGGSAIHCCFWHEIKKALSH